MTSSHGWSTPHQHPPTSAEPPSSAADAVAARIAGQGAREQQAEVRAATPTWLRIARRVLCIHDDERAWRRGAEGEEAVAKSLAKLSGD